MTGQLTASRVMKARRETLCPYCHQPIRVGNRIGKTNLGWLHIGCVIARMYQLEPGHDNRTEGNTP